MSRWKHLECGSRTSDVGVYLECEIGDFTVPGHWTSSVTFVEQDAAILARLATAIAVNSQQVLLAFYPWAQEAWKEISASRWSTHHERVFRRRGLLGLGGENQWVIGHAHDEEKLAEVLYWAWTLPGRDTLLIIPAEPHEIDPLIQAFEDDREDDGSNEVRLLKWYPVVLSRGREAKCVRMFGTSIDREDIAALISRSSA